MYQLTKEAFGLYTKYVVHDPETGHGYSIVPEMGATVLDILFDDKSILDGYKTPEELSAAKWGKSSVLFPFPNRLKDGRYTWAGKTYEFPINNAATGNAIHGFARGEAFEVVAQEMAQESATLTMRLDYDGRYAFYPFSVSVELTFSLHNTGVFEAHTKVINHSDVAVPFGYGWHPYFNLTGQVEDHVLQVPPAQQVLIDERMIPTGERVMYTAFEQPTRIDDTVLDTCFYSNTADEYVLALSGGGRTIRIKAAGNSWPYFQIFTPPHRNSIAIEPMTCNVDALNNGDGLIELEVMGQWSGGVVIELAE